MTAYFVTATGTEIGKTYIAAGIVAAARAAGNPATAIKPIMSGYDGTDPAGSDAGILLAAMGQPPDPAQIAAISPWRYVAAISPDMAAAREQRPIALADVISFCETAIAAAPGLMLVEGAGGLMAPLNATHNMRGLIGTLGLPVILVAGTYLGTISHTLTAAEALNARGIGTAAVVLSESPASPVEPEETAAAIRRFLPFTAVKIVPRHASSAVFADLFAHLTQEARSTPGT